MVKPDVESLRANFRDPHELVHTTDGKILFVRRWDATSNRSGTSVLIFHGITAYSAPYGQILAEQLSAEGYDVYGMDLRGHGLSDGTRGDYPSSKRLVEDLLETVELVKSRSKKLIVLGHSLGALSAIISVNNSQAIDGVVLLSIARKIRTGVYKKPKTSEVAKLLLGVTILRGTPLIQYSREGMLGVADPLFNFKYSARFYSVMYGVGALSVSRMFRTGIVDSPNLKFKVKLRVPLLVAVGEKDELFSPEYSREFCEEIECDDKQFFVAPGARHAAFPKGCLDQLVASLNDWQSKWQREGGTS